MQTLVGKLTDKVDDAAKLMVESTDSDVRLTLLQVVEALQDMKNLVTSHINDYAVDIDGVDAVFLLDLDSPTGTTLTESSEYVEVEHNRRRTDK